MKKTDYLSLINSRFLNNDGTVMSYWDYNDAPYDYKIINNLMCSQLDEIIDYNNIIILHPLAIGGQSSLFGNKKYNMDHISNLVDTKYILESKGIKFKNGESLLSRKYSQTFFSMFIVKDGIAYVSTKTSNPFNGSASLCCNDKYKDIHVNYEDLNHININDLNIMFSGFFKENSKNERNERKSA